MSDIKLDPATGDIDLATGTVEMVTGVDAIAQQVRIALRMFKGEWFLDVEQGVPYFQDILGKRLRPNLVDALLRQAILEVPGVVSISRFERSFDGATRVMTVSFTAVADDGLIDDTLTIGGGTA